MKLLNKKTGEIVNVIVYSPIGNYNIRIWKDKDYLDVTCNDGYLGEYKTLAELNDEWEDCKEPLIKDEKIRKAVRAWAEAVDADSAFVEKWVYDGDQFVLSDNLAEIRFRINTPKEVKVHKRYSIAELCGEEKE